MHQGIVAVGRPPAELPFESLVADRPDLIVALDGVTDPRNAGAVFRSAEAAGAGAVLVGRDRAPGLSPALVKAAAGAVEWLPVARVTNLARALEGLSEARYWLIGLAGDADRDLYDVSATPGLPLVLIVGSEGTGLRPIVRRACHRLLRIPMRGRTESLNVSVAAAVSLARAVERRVVERGRHGDLGEAEAAALRERFYVLAVKQRARIAKAARVAERTAARARPAPDRE